MSNVPATGWYVEVDHPSGRTLTPGTVGSPSRNPQVNGYPRLEIPVKARPVWDDIDLKNNDVKMRVWFDGQPQPVDELEDVEGDEGSTRTLIGRGGLELRNRVREEWQSIPFYQAAEQIVSQNTSYAVNADRPETTVRNNVLLQEAASISEIRSLSASDLDIVGDRGSGEWGPAQSCWTTEVENYDGSSGNMIASSDSSASAGEKVTINASEGSYLEYEFTTEHTIPESAVEVAVRWKDNITDGSSFNFPDLTIFLDGQSVGVILSNRIDFEWDIYNEDVVSDDIWQWSGDLESGTHKLRLEITDVPSNDDPVDTFDVDVVAPRDRRWTYTDDNSISNGERVDGPELYPLEVREGFSDVTSIDAVVGGRIEADVTDTSNQQAVALSNDRGETYPLTASNTTTLEGDFGDFGGFLRWQVTYSRYGERDDATPRTGYQSQRITGWTLKGDLEDMPLLVDQSIDTSVADALTTLAEDSDSLWEIRKNRDGIVSVEWADPGQRVSDRSVSVSQFTSSRTVEDAIERVTVKGSKRRTRAEAVTADHGNWVSLAEDDVLKGQEAVYDPANTDVEYTADEDYRIRGQAGEIKTLSSGAISDGQTIEIDYFYKPKASYTSETAGSDLVQRVVDLPGLPTERACGQAARRLVRQLDDPLKEARVTIPADEAGWQVIEAQEIAELPFDGPLEVRDVQNTPEQTVLRLGSRQTFGEAISRLRQRLDSVSGRT